MRFFFGFLVLGCAFFFVNGAYEEKSMAKPGDDPLQLASCEVYPDRKNNVDGIRFRFYTGKDVSEHVDFELDDAMEIMQQQGFNKNNPTVFYIHGYKEKPDDESIRTVVGAYLTYRPGTNVILIDWSNMAGCAYTLNAAPNTRKVAQASAAAIKKLLDNGMEMDKVHVVGHSLGGQTAGYIGKDLQKLGTKLKRISALDPAFPMFYPGLVLGHIDKNDADFVDVIHTDAGGYGGPVNTGTVDFWPNKGVKHQPGCPKGFHMPMTPDDLCSHWRSWRFWADSVARPESFPAVRDGKTVYMGFGAQPGIQGDYYLTTNDASPFGKGQAGVVRA